MTLHDFIFTTKKPQKFYRHIVFWVVQNLFWGFWVTVFFCNWTDTLQCFIGGGFLVLEMGYTYAIVYHFYPKYVPRRQYKQFICSVLSFSFFTYLIYVSFHLGTCDDITDKPLMLWYFSVNFFISGPPVLCALFLTLKMLKNFYLKMEEQQMLIKENGEAELQLLKGQIHPHFLFNTLNNIYSFALSRSEKTRNLVLKLSDTLSYMVYDCEAEMVSLEKELKLLKDYMGLEKVRYGNRLSMQVCIEGSMEDKFIAPLLMIPFIENCFKHGTSQVLQHPWIKLNICVENDVLLFELSNSKPENVISKTGKGIGLSNVQKRLALIYPHKHQLEIYSTEDSFFVRMQVELQYVPNAQEIQKVFASSQTLAYA